MCCLRTIITERPIRGASIAFRSNAMLHSPTAELASEGLNPSLDLIGSSWRAGWEVPAPVDFRSRGRCAFDRRTAWRAETRRLTPDPPLVKTAEKWMESTLPIRSRNKAPKILQQSPHCSLLCPVPGSNGSRGNDRDQLPDRDGALRRVC